MAAADRLLGCIASTSELGLTFCTHGDAASLFSYVDSSYDCYSDTTFLYILADILAHSYFFPRNKQKTNSSTVAEFVTTHSACQKIY